MRFFYVFLSLFFSLSALSSSESCRQIFENKVSQKRMNHINNPNQKKTFDTLIVTEKTLIYEGNEFVVKENQAIGITGGKIQFVGEADASLNAKKTYKLPHHLASPGLINSHTHLPMSLFKGLVDNTSLQEWLEDYIFPLESKLVNEDFIKVGTEFAALELIKGGVTTFADMYFYNDVMAQSLDKSGLRGFIGIGIPSVEKDWKEWKKKFLELEKKYKDHKRISFALAPHAPYTVSPEDLKAIGDFAKKEGVPIFIHVSETKWEQDQILKAYGKTPVEHLHGLNITGSQSLFAHGIHLNEKDMQILSETNTAVSYNPGSNMKISSGICPVPKLLKKGIRVGLGTDGSGSNNNLSLVEEMGTGAKLQSLKNNPACFGAMDIFKMATIMGAEALGLEKEIGTIEEGKRADLIAFDISRTEFLPAYNLISQIVYSANGSEVDFTMVEGKVLMEDGKVKSLDQEVVHQKTTEYGKKIENFLKKENSL